MSAKQIVHCKCDEGEPSNPQCHYHGGKMKHTPGPWFVDEDRLGHTHIVDNEYSIAQVSRDNADNARLLAAAPEMLSALQYVTTLLRFEKNFPEETEVLSVVKRAIAKATGGTP